MRGRLRSRNGRLIGLLVFAKRGERVFSENPARILTLAGSFLALAVLSITLGALSYLAVRLVHRWRWKSAVIAFSMTIIVAVASSRVYLGVHWISDIGAGISAGILWLTISTVGYETVRRLRLVRHRRRSIG